MFGRLTEVYASLAIRLSYPFLFRTCPFQKPFDTIYDLGMDYMGYDPGHNATSARLFKNIFGSCETVTAYGTYQYDTISMTDFEPMKSESQLAKISFQSICAEHMKLENEWHPAFKKVSSI